MKELCNWCARLLALLAATGFISAVAQTVPRVAFDTSAGPIVIELAPQQAPKTVANFLEYVKAGHYDNTVFHRVISGFMIQGGGFNPDMAEKPVRAPIPLESQSGLKNERGTLSMARRPDPNSATSQFFINVVDNSRLDYPSPDGHGYAVFGKVVEGMDIVDKIAATPTTTVKGYQNVPAAAVIIKTARVVK